MDLKAIRLFHLDHQRGLPRRGGVAAARRAGKWQAWAVVIGMATSVVGMFVRCLSHRKDRHDIHRAEREALTGTAERAGESLRRG